MNTSNKMIGVSEEAKTGLNKMKTYPRETYNDIIIRLTNHTIQNETTNK